MSRDDFERCTPAEFQEIHIRWAEARKQTERGEWERTRTMVFASLQPYMKGRATPHDVLPRPKEAEELARKGREEVSRAEIESRFAAARKSRGLL